MESKAKKRRICRPAPRLHSVSKLNTPSNVVFPAALTPAQRTIHETASTGIAEVDALLEGGLPAGAISEINGPESSGRTTLALSFVAQRTAAGQVCAWVDADDAFDPESAAANGIHLPQLLWVRCRKPGTPTRQRPSAKPFAQLDQALRATDLLLQAGGFAAIILDLGDTAFEHARRIPLATLVRPAPGCRPRTNQPRCYCGGRLRTIQRCCYALECAALHPLVAGDAVLRGFQFQVRRERQRFMPFAVNQKKPPARVWPATGAWDTEQSA